MVAGWPLKFLLLGFPLWWVLGLSTFIFPIMAIPMAWQLWKRGAVRLPPAFWLWAVFLVWQFVSLVMFDANPTGTHAGSTSNRILSLAVSYVLYAGITVTLLYVANLPISAVPQAAVARWMGAFFLTVAAGGFLGMLYPRLSFPSLVELVLPHRLTESAYVRVLVHPVASQVQAVLGTESGRPAAPFSYTNDWAAAIGILLVWYVAAFVLPLRGRRSLVPLGVAAASLVPIVVSLNRGLWIALVFIGVWLTVRQLAQRRIRVLLTGVAVLVAALAIIGLTPLRSIIEQRLHNGTSDNIRSFVAARSITAIEHSPILGYGGNRHTDGSYQSIAVGPTVECSTCGDVPTGSTGQLWAVMFNQGITGVIAYFGFFGASLWIYRRERGAINEAALATIALVFVYMWFYLAVPAAPTLTMVAVGVLDRARQARVETRQQGG